MTATKIRESADAMVQAVKGYVGRALEPIQTRMAAVETKVGALAMLAGGRKDTTDALERRIVALEARIAELENAR